MRKGQLPKNGNVLVLAVCDGRRRPLANAVDRHDRRISEWRRIERARRMRQVMLWEINRRPAVPELRQMLVEEALHEQFFLDPDRYGGRKAQKAARGKPMIRFEQTLELQQRLVVERDGVEVLVFPTGLLQHVSSRVNWEGRVVTLPRESLFLSGCDNLAVDEKRRGAVVVVRRYSENSFFHVFCPPVAPNCYNVALSR